MARKRSQPEVSRRKFLAGAAVAGAAAASTSVANAATARDDRCRLKRLPAAVPPSVQQIANETAIPKEMPHLAGKPNSDFMVDVIKSLKIDYIYSNPASSFRGLHESLINYGKNTMPEFLTVHARRIVGRDGARLLQGRPASRRWCSATAPSACSTRPWRSTTPGRPRAGHHGRRQRSRRRAPSAGRADCPLGAGHQRDGARLHQVGRHSRCRRSTSRSRSCAPTRSR